jgi:hypothetical protein
MAVEHYEVNLWDGWDTAYARMQARLDQALRRDARMLLSPPEETWPSWSRESTRLILVPVFVGTYRGRTGELPVIVNGATGAVSGTWEWSLTARLVGIAILLGLSGAALGALWGVWLLLRAAGFRPLW